MTEYKKHLKTISLAPSTVRSYIWHLSKFLDWLGDKEMTEANFKKYHSYLIKNSQRVNTVNLRLKIINNYLKFLGKRFRFDLLSDEDVPIQILTDQQLEQFLDNAKKNKTLIGKRDKALLELLYATGLKVGKIIKLRLDQIDELKKELVLSPKKQIKLSSLTWFYLEKYIRQRNDDSPWLFINFDRSNKGKEDHLSVRSVERIISKNAKGIDPPVNVNPQILRNTLAQRLKSEGAEGIHIKNALHFKTKVAAKKYLDRI